MPSFDRSKPIRGPLPLRASALLLATSLLASPPSRAAAQDGDHVVDPELYSTMEWRLIGPFRGGRSVAAAGVAGDPSTYYFGGVGGGIWKTEDAGIRWTNVSDGFLHTASVGALAVAPSDPNVVYAGMGEHAPRGVTTSHGDGVYRSTDAGRTWTHLGLEATRAISRVIVHPDDPDHVYVAVQGAPYGPSEDRGVYRSTDGGSTWEKILYVNPSSGASELSMDPSNPRVLYAAFWDHQRDPWVVRSGGPGSGLWKSTDGGDSWNPINEGLPDLMGKTAVSVSGADPDRVFAMIEAEPDGGVFRSDDAGATWTRVNDTRGLRSRPWYYIEIFADPQDENTVYVLNAPFWRSIDGGRTFQSIRVGHGDTHDLWINPDDNGNMILADDGGAEVTFNGGQTWSTLNNQPTAQFYRVNADNQFPYWVYGGQQDNSSVAIKSRDLDGSIGPADFRPSAGCESAYLAFDPDNPRFQYGGCYLGQISERDEATGLNRNVQVRPGMPASVEPQNMKYRFNWNAPILVSPHDPDVIYHASNHLLRTTDRGYSWEEISPDLTKDDPRYQGAGGGPITNEGAGGEVYGTIFSVAPSPVEEDVIWTGSDDGLIHVTRDGGANWTDVTPPDLPEEYGVNAVDASPHDPGAAYVALTAYKFNDFTPMAFKTSDYGASWERITTGIPADHWVRVVREDTERRGLLYAGTELGAFVSFNDGENWQPLQLDLPVTPITDLKVHQGDLVASTQGRAFWILDDLSPLRQLHEQGDAVAGADTWLFQPRDAWRLAGGGGFGGGGGPTVGSNPPTGAVVHFKAADDSAEVRMEFLDQAGTVLRTFSSKPGDGLDAPDRLAVEEGVNRHVWNLRRESVPGVEGLFVFGTLRGGLVPPGRYTVRLTVGDGEPLTTDFQVVDIPQHQAEFTAADHRARESLLARIRSELEDLHQSVTTMGRIRDQVEAAVDRASEHAQAERIEEAGSALTDSVAAVDSMLVQRKWTTGQDPTVFTTRLNQFFIYLHGAVDGTPGAPTQGMTDQFQELTDEWEEYEAQVEWILGPGVDDFNELLRELGVEAVETRRRIVS